MVKTDEGKKLEDKPEPPPPIQKPKFVSIKFQKFAICFSFFILPILYVPIQIFRNDINNSNVPQSIGIISIPQTSDIFAIIITGVIGFIVFLSIKGLRDIFTTKYKLSISEYKNALLLYNLIPRIMYATVTVFATTLGILIINAQLHFTLIKDPFITLVLVISFIPSLIIGLFAGLHTTFHEKIKNFELHLAKMYLKTIETNDPTTEKIRLIIKAVTEYDDHIFHKIKMRINNLDHFYSKLAFENTDIDHTLKTIDEKLELDDIELARYLKDELDDVKTEPQIDKPHLLQIKEFLVNPRYISIFSAISYFILQFTEASKILDFIRKLLDGSA